MTKWAVVLMPFMSRVVATEFRRRDAEHQLMDGPRIAGIVGGHEGRRDNARHCEAKAKRQGEDDRGPDRHAKDMAATSAKVNGVDLRQRIYAIRQTFTLRASNAGFPHEVRMNIVAMRQQPTFGMPQRKSA